MPSRRDEIAFEADRLPRREHATVEFDPPLRLVRHHIADLLSDDIGNAGVTRVGSVCLDVNIIAEPTVRPIEELDDAKALVDRVEQRPVATFSGGGPGFGAEMPVNVSRSELLDLLFKSFGPTPKLFDLVWIHAACPAPVRSGDLYHFRIFMRLPSPLVRTS